MDIIFTMNENKEIQIDLMDRLRLVVTSQYKRATNTVKDDFFENNLYSKILNEYSTIPLNVEVNSIFSIFSLLSANPNKNVQEIQNSYRYMDKYSDIRITNYPSFLTQNLFNMVQFINLSTYLYKRYEYEQRSKQERAMLLKMLIVSASTLYDELYSSRGKIEFAYYFKKLLENDDNFTKTITPYNKESWRGEYAKYTRLAKDEIDTICEISKKKEEIVSISNLLLIYGKRIDEKLPHLGERYVIEAGISSHKHEYNRIFITTFQ